MDVLLGVVGNLGIFSCGRKDAERLVKEALHFTGEAVRDTATGRTFTPNEEVEAAIKEVMRAGRQEMLFKPRGKTPWFARTLCATFPTVDPVKREEFIRESARIYWRKPEEKQERTVKDRL